MTLPTQLVDQLAALVAVRDWPSVSRLLIAADDIEPIDVGALEVLAEAQWWQGQVDSCIATRLRAMERFESLNEPVAVARIALLLAEDHRRQGRGAVAESWRRHAEERLADLPETAEHGYLLLYHGEVTRRSGDLETARRFLVEAAAIARRTASADLTAEAMQELGRIMILSGSHVEGLAMMDDAMRAASAGRLSPYTTGKVYCCLMSACDTLGDIQRVAEWERTSAAWSRIEGAAVFPGMCRVHRAELLALRGRWPEAEHEVQRACEELREVGWIVGYAHNTLGQIRCRRGDFDGANASYLQAEASMLLLRRGNIGGAMRRIARAVAATPSPPLVRARLLPTLVEVAIAASDLATAASAAAELATIAGEYNTSKLQAEACLARTRVYLANEEWVAAAATAQTALRQWQDLVAPYEAATTWVLHARACRALDDHDSWATSLAFAAELFRTLGATADHEQTQALRRPASPASPFNSNLTAREVAILQLVATGATNKMIATQLFISQKTVSRHLTNIFTKLGVTTRAAATAYAYENQFIAPR
jgi:DNA-binding CsgD family transcriptional regulator